MQQTGPLQEYPASVQSLEISEDLVFNHMPKLSFPLSICKHKIMEAEKCVAMTISKSRSSLCIVRRIWYLMFVYYITVFLSIMSWWCPTWNCPGRLTRPLKLLSSPSSWGKVSFFMHISCPALTDCCSGLGLNKHNLKNLLLDTGLWMEKLSCCDVLFLRKFCQDCLNLYLFPCFD